MSVKLVPTKRFSVFDASAASSKAAAPAPAAAAAAAPADDPELTARLESLLKVGEECVTPEDLRALRMKSDSDADHETPSDFSVVSVPRLNRFQNLCCFF